MKFLESLSIALAGGDSADAMSSQQLFAEFLRGSVSAAGVEITPEKSLQISGVWSSVCILSEAVGSLPLIVYRRLPGGRGKERATDHPLYRILRSRPNRRHVASEYRSLQQLDVETYGNALSRKIVVRDQVQELFPFPWRRILDVRESAAGTLTYVANSNDGRQFEMREDQVVHFRGPGGDGIRGAAVAEQFRETFGLAYALELYLAYTLKNSGRVGGFISKKTGTLSEPALERLKKWRDEQVSGIQNAGKWTFVPEPDLQFDTTSMNFDEAKIGELDDKVLARLARIYRVPLHMLASNVAQPRANMEQQSREFVDQSLRPRLTRIEERFNAEFFDDGEEYFCEFLLEELLRGDAAARALVYRALIELGIMTRNEARERENLNKLEGLDEPLTPLNMGRGQDNKNLPPGSALEELERVAAVSDPGSPLRDFAAAIRNLRLSACAAGGSRNGHSAS